MYREGRGSTEPPVDLGRLSLCRISQPNEGEVGLESLEEAKSVARSWRDPEYL